MACGASAEESPVVVAPPSVEALVSTKVYSTISSAPLLLQPACPAPLRARLPQQEMLRQARAGRRRAGQASAKLPPPEPQAPH